MRAGLLRAWPGLSHYYNIHPWDVERLSYAEIDAYVQDLREIARRLKQADRDARHRR